MPLVLSVFAVTFYPSYFIFEVCCSVVSSLKSVLESVIKKFTSVSVSFDLVLFSLSSCRSAPVLCCSTSQPCWSAACQPWSLCWSQSRWDCSVSVPVKSRCCRTGTPCSTTPVRTTSTHCTAPRRLSTHCKYSHQGG